MIGSKVTGPSHIDRTTATSYIKLPFGFLPRTLADFVKIDQLILTQFKDQEGLKIGPIPEGTPVGLLSNLDLDPGEHLTLDARLKRDRDFIELAKRAKSDLKNSGEIPDDRQKQRMLELTDLLLKVSKCPDLIVNRGHYFGTDLLDPSEHEPGLSDQDKRALVAFLKTF